METCSIPDCRRRAEYICHRCNRLLCAGCAEFHHGDKICPNCAAKEEVENRKLRFESTKEEGENGKLCFESIESVDAPLFSRP